ncbi:hypothetical protein BKA65DRAFT_570220 [Rhexocercosporidium sp. MPI-PUGE-AT-0058]|nr:hypothetical protein BKA65DRAFT_570220 [Rhexocercosporidium sp. MPI-PUGE-AT-0058]
MREMMIIWNQGYSPKLLMETAVLARTRSGGGGGDRADPIELSSASPSPLRQTRRATVASSRVDKASGRIKKLSPAPARPGPRPAGPSKTIARAARAARKADRKPSRGTEGKSPPRSPRFERHPRSSSPDSVPIVLQLSLNSNVQELLERTVFYWTKQWIPEVLKKKGWKEPEQLELTYWFRVFDQDGHLKPKCEQALAESRTGLSYAGLRKLMGSLSEIRHSAVHRRSLSTPTLRKVMADAIQLTHYLDDPLRNQKIREMQKRLLRNDLAELEEIINTPLEEFKTKGEISGAPAAKKGGEEAALAPAPEKQIEVPGEIETDAFGKKQSEVVRETLLDATQRARAVLGMELESKSRAVKGESLSNSKQVLPSVKREFGSRRKKMRHAASNTHRGGGKSISDSFSRHEVIDLTDDAEDGLENTKCQLASEKSTASDRSLTSNKRPFAAFEEDFIEISDDDQGYPNMQDDDGEEDDEPMAFSNAPRRLPNKKSKRSQQLLRMGIDY